MSLFEMPTSFGRVRTNGHLAIADTGKADPKLATKLYSSAIRLAEWLWTLRAPDESLPWPDTSEFKIETCAHPDGKQKCSECDGTGTSECHACGNDADCDDCDGHGNCDCESVLGLHSLPIREPLMLGLHADTDGQPLGINPLYLEAVNRTVGPISKLWFGPIYTKRQATSAFIFVGENGRAIVMGMRSGNRR